MQGSALDADILALGPGRVNFLKDTRAESRVNRATNFALTPIMQVETETYSPAAILLTGGAGFIGSNVAIRIVQQHPSIKVGR